MVLLLGAGSPSNTIEVRNTSKDGCDDTTNITDSYSFNKNSFVLNDGKQTLLMNVLNNEEEDV